MSYCGIYGVHASDSSSASPAPHRAVRWRRRPMPVNLLFGDISKTTYDVIPFQTTGYGYTQATKTLYHTNDYFSTYTPSGGDDYIYLTDTYAHDSGGGTDVRINTGWYKIASKVDDYSITLAVDPISYDVPANDPPYGIKPLGIALDGLNFWTKATGAGWGYDADNWVTLADMTDAAAIGKTSLKWTPNTATDLWEHFWATEGEGTDCTGCGAFFVRFYIHPKEHEADELNFRPAGLNCAYEPSTNTLTLPVGTLDDWNPTDASEMYVVIGDAAIAGITGGEFRITAKTSGNTVTLASDPVGVSTASGVMAYAIKDGTSADAINNLKVSIFSETKTAETYECLAPQQFDIADLRPGYDCGYNTTTNTLTLSSDALAGYSDTELTGKYIFLVGSETGTTTGYYQITGRPSASTLELSTDPATGMITTGLRAMGIQTTNSIQQGFNPGWHVWVASLERQVSGDNNLVLDDITGIRVTALQRTSSRRPAITFDQIAMTKAPASCTYPSTPHYHVMTFDDAPANQRYSYAYCLGKGICPSVGLIGSFVGQTDNLTLDQVQTFAMHGVEFCNHTWSHFDSTSNPPNWSNRTQAERIADVKQMRDWLIDNGLGRGANVLITPQGEWVHEDEHEIVDRYASIVRLVGGAGQLRETSESVQQYVPARGLVTVTFSHDYVNNDAAEGIDTLDIFAGTNYGGDNAAGTDLGGLFITMSHMQWVTEPGAAAADLMAYIDKVADMADAGEIECVTLGELIGMSV